jgi:hypothetical protein
MSLHVLPTLPEPVPPPRRHVLPSAAPGRYDEPLDLGTGQAAFLVACLVLALTLAMGILAIGELTDRDGVLAHNERSVLAHEARAEKILRAAPTMESGGRFVPVAGPSGTSR